MRSAIVKFLRSFLSTCNDCLVKEIVIILWCKYICHYQTNNWKSFRMNTSTQVRDKLHMYTVY